MANTPAFADTPNIQVTDSPTTADNVYTGPTAPTGIFTAGASGSVVELIQFKAKGTNVATVARIFRAASATPTTYQLIDEVTLPATTAAAAAAIAPVAIIPAVSLLQPGDLLFLAIGTTIASGYTVTVQAMDL